MASRCTRVPAVTRASMSGYAPLAAPRGHWPAPLPVPAAPLAGEALASFLGRLAAANRTTPGVLLDILPPWFRVKARWHNDRWLPSSLTPWADDAAARLAVISGSTAAAVKNALPAFGGTRGQPVRGRHRMPPLRGSPPDQPACPGPPARPPPGLPQARHLAVRAGNTAVQRQRLPRHPGRRAPGPTPPSPPHHRAADLLQDPSGRRPGRPRLEAPDAGPHRVQPPASDRIECPGAVPGCGLPRSHRRS